MLCSGWFCNSRPRPLSKMVYRNDTSSGRLSRSNNSFAMSLGRLSARSTVVFQCDAQPVRSNADAVRQRACWKGTQ